MDDQRTGGGAANTPPFPRLVRGEAGHQPGGAMSGDPPPPGATPNVAASGGGPRSPRDDSPGSEPARGRPSSRETQVPRPVFAPSTANPRPVSDAANDFRRRAEDSLHRGFERIADRLEDAAERIERLAEDRLEAGGPRARAGELAYSAAGAMGDLSEYLRASGIDSLRADLERQVRERPVQSLLLAAGAGWLLGKILR